MGPDSHQHILRPVRLSTIVLSFVGALLLNFLPWGDLRLVPDFVALTIAFWCVRQPRLVGLGVAWTLGLLTDAGNGDARPHDLGESAGHHEPAHGQWRDQHAVLVPDHGQ